MTNLPRLLAAVGARPEQRDLMSRRSKVPRLARPQWRPTGEPVAYTTLGLGECPNERGQMDSLSAFAAA